MFHKFDPIEFIEMIIYTHQQMFGSLLLLRLLRYFYFNDPIDFDPNDSIDPTIDDILDHYDIVDSYSQAAPNEKTVSLLIENQARMATRDNTPIQKRIISFLLIWFDQAIDHFEQPQLKELAETFLTEVLNQSPTHPLFQKLQNMLKHVALPTPRIRSSSKILFCNHSDIYLKARDAIITGQLPCSLDDDLSLAAICIRIEVITQKQKNLAGERLLTFIRNSLRTYFRNRVSSDIYNSLQTAQKIQDLYETDYVYMSEREAKHSYIDICKSLETYGFIFFPVKQQNLKEMKIYPRRLGISDDKIVILEQDTNKILSSWTVNQVRTCRSTSDFLLLKIANQESGIHINSPDSSYIAKLVQKFLKRKGLGKGFKLDIKYNRGCPPDPFTEMEVHTGTGDAIIDALRSMGTISASVGGPVISSTITLTALDALSFVGEMARQLTLVEHENYKEVTITSLLEYLHSKKKNLESTHSVREIISHFNKISDWVSSEIVREVDDDKRLFLLKQFIFLGKTLLEINNINGVMEILSGLNSAPVRKVQQTWNCLSKDELAAFKQLEDLMSSRSNYSEYRNYISTPYYPCLPYFGLYLTDLTFVNDGNSDYSNGLWNILKRKKQYEILQNFVKFKEREFVFFPITTLQNYIMSIQPLSEDERYSLAIALSNKN